MRILFVGETWITHTVHIKGLDSFEQSSFGSGTSWIKKATENAGYIFDHLPSHQAIDSFPDAKHLKEYDVIIFSDIGSNTLLLSTKTMTESKPVKNHLEEVKEYVANGGGFAMIGGYMSFQGIGGKACYAGSPIEEILPVKLLEHDDRTERPQGVVPIVVKEHEIVNGLPAKWPTILGYNKVLPKDDAQILVTCGEDILVAVGEYGKGRSMVFTSDCAPHWAPPEFLDWFGYNQFWGTAIKWLGSKQ